MIRKYLMLFSLIFQSLFPVLLVAKLNAYGLVYHHYDPYKAIFQSGNKERLTQSSAYGRKFHLGYLNQFLGALLFNIFLCNLFFIMSDTEFASYADDSVSFFVGKDIDYVLLK